MSTQHVAAPAETGDFMPLHGIDHVEFYVGNALQAAQYWSRALGFREVAYAGLETVDHIVGNVELGEMDRWVRYYEQVFGMREMIHFSDEDISTEYSALMSKVVTSGNGRVKFPLNEPAEGRRKSQIDEYLEYYGGPGAQHIAVATRDIVATDEALQERGVEFLKTPEAYYDDLPGRVGEIGESLEDLQRLG